MSDDRLECWREFADGEERLVLSTGGVSEWVSCDAHYAMEVRQ